MYLSYLSHWCNLQVIGQTESNRAQDMWSCGVVTYMLLCGFPPFLTDTEEKSETDLLRQIVNGDFNFHADFWDHISEKAKDFVASLLCKDPTLRMTVEEALSHPWILHSALTNHSLPVMVINWFKFSMHFIKNTSKAFLFTLLRCNVGNNSNLISLFWRALCSLLKMYWGKIPKIVIYNPPHLRIKQKN